MRDMTLTATWTPAHTDGSDDDLFIGGMSDDPTWDEYLAKFLDARDRDVVTAVREAVEREGLDLYGDDLQRGAFVLSDGQAAVFSMRAWGDLRQAMVGKREGYMRYYMRQG